MSHYSVAEAKNNLPKLLDRMLAGEEVVITRRGKAIARLAPEPSQVQGAVLDMAWIEASRPPSRKPDDLKDTVHEMREDYRY